MSGKVAGVLLTVVSLVAIGALVWWEAGRTAPGPLSPTHGAVAALEGEEGCSACHASAGGSSVRGCPECHPREAEQLVSGTGFHGHMEDAAACAACHGEHHGEELPLVSKRSFALAGFPDREAYDHRGVEHGLVGRHADLSCADCHPGADRTFLRPGETRFAGRSSVCAACHEDAHGGTHGSHCGACHDQIVPFSAATFAHAPDFPLVGGHDDVTCERCHPPGTDRSVARQAAGETGPTRNCADCHADPHAGRFAVDGTTHCARCHDEWGFVPSRFGPVDHARLGFELVGRHRDAACAACHEAGARREVPRACAGCHEADRVRAREPDHVGMGFPRDCARCHDPSGWEGVVFFHRFPIERGDHRRLRCADCHRDPVDVTAFECRACHAHRRSEMDDEHRRVRGYVFESRACYRCHPRGEKDRDDD